MIKIRNLLTAPALAALVAGTLAPLGTAPAFAQSNGVPARLDDAIGSVNNAVDDIRNLIRPRTIFATSTGRQPPPALRSCLELDPVFRPGNSSTPSLSPKRVKRTSD